MRPPTTRDGQGGFYDLAATREYGPRREHSHCRPPPGLMTQSQRAEHGQDAEQEGEDSADHGATPGHCGATTSDPEPAQDSRHDEREPGKHRSSGPGQPLCALDGLAERPAASRITRSTKGDLEQRDARLQHGELALEVAIETLATAHAS